MNQEIVPIHRMESIREDGMLFVRTEGILPTMVKAPLIVAGLIIVTIAMPIQNSFASTRTLDLIIYPNGLTHISSQIDVDPLNPDFELSLFGPTIDNFVAVGENGFLLSSEIFNDSALVDTLGSSNISLEYDIHDLVSKEGRTWTFSINAPTDYSLVMPTNSVIVGMSTLPLDMEVIDEQTRLFLPAGESEVNYIFSSVPISPTPNPDNSTKSDFDNYILFAGGVITAAGIGGALFLRKSKSSKKSGSAKRIQTETIPKKIIDVETIFRLRPEMREDDKEIVRFIFDNGGEAFESELRKKFLQPRTTMWRAVKRLERQDIVQIKKKEMQNLVKLNEELEEEK